MKKIIVKITAAVMSMALVMAAVPSVQEAHAMQPLITNINNQQGSIVVNGNGTVMIEPDMATVQIGVSHTAESATEAQNEAAAVIVKIAEALKELGIDEKDVQTISYSMWPQYDWVVVNPRSGMMDQVLIGYQVQHMLRVIIREIDDIGKVLEATADAGANQNWGLSFDVENRDELYIKALVAAIEDAHTKAETLAKTFNVTVGLPVSVTEGFVNNWGMQTFGIMAMSDSMMFDRGGSGIQTGQVEISASVTVMYMFDR